ncbi:MAG: permease [Firmicutes bacterium]|nr:permease [Bacillota bacterium]
MDPFTLSLWVIALIALLFFLAKDRKRTLGSMQMTKGMMGGLLGELTGILFLIGLILTFVPPETIKAGLGQSNVVLASILAAVAGSVTLIPAFVAFPLVGSLVNVGASIVPAVAFLTTLTMVGLVTFPLEKREFGQKFALYRNGLSFVFALVIAWIMGVLK